MANLLREEALDLFRLSVKEVHDFYSSHNSRVVWFTSIISALLGGTVSGIFWAEKSYPYALIILILGPICILAVSQVAFKSIRLAHRYLLEAITTRAKYEQYLGLDRPPIYDGEDDLYWTDEGFVPLRYLGGRKNKETSEEWVDSRLNAKGIANWWPVALFRLAQLSACFLAVVIILLLIREYYPQFLAVPDLEACPKSMMASLKSGGCLKRNFLRLLIRPRGKSSERYFLTMRRNF